MTNCHVINTTRTTPTIPFTTIKEAILGKTYRLSVALIGATRARALNKSTRGKTYSPNVLSFPLNDTTGEIYLCPMTARREARKFGRNETTQLTFLFIHGLLHLRGYDHGPAMEALERRWCTRFHCAVDITLTRS